LTNTNKVRPAISNRLKSIGTFDCANEQFRENVKENQILASTRDYLLPKLLSGEVEVKEAVG
jgi:hypothetical protein